MARYTDLNTLLADLLPEITSESQKAAVGRTLDGVCSFIDRYCRRPSGYFSPAAETGTVKKIRGEGEKYLRLPVHVAGSVTIANVLDSVWYESDNGWIVYSRDSDAARIGDLDDYSERRSYGVFVRGKLYDVTARWGFEVTPLDIEQAARLLTQKVWETQRGVLGDITPAGYVVERAMPVFVRETLDLYKRREFELV